MFKAPRFLALGLAALQFIPAYGFAQTAPNLAPTAAEAQKMIEAQNAVEAKVDETESRLNIDSVLSEMARRQKPEQREHLFSELDLAVLKLTPEEQVALYNSLLQKIDSAIRTPAGWTIGLTVVAAYFVLSGGAHRMAGKRETGVLRFFIAGGFGFVAAYQGKNWNNARYLESLRPQIIALRDAAQSLCRAHTL